MQRMAECWQVKKMNQKNKTKKNPAAAGCNALGIFLLIALVAVCLPLTLPKAFGYHIYTVVSGSMEPAIMTGSLVYIKEEAPEDMQQDDIIAFYGTKDGVSIITHRVVENRVLMGEFITKGDANKTQDMNPVPYGNFIGRVERIIPSVGEIAQVLTSTAGKIAAACIIAASILLQFLASYLAKKE